MRDETKGAAERRQNIATAEGRGFRLGKTNFAGCALSRLHSQPLIAPAGAKDFFKRDSLSPLTGLVFPR